MNIVVGNHSKHLKNVETKENEKSDKDFFSKKNERSNFIDWKPTIAILKL